MVQTCVVSGCKSRAVKGNGLSWHRIPDEDEFPSLRARWLQALQLEDDERLYGCRVCSLHFVSGKRRFDEVHPDHVPCINLPMAHSARYHHTASTRTMEQRLERFNRHEARQGVHEDQTHPDSASKDHGCIQTMKDVSGVSCQTEPIIKIWKTQGVQTEVSMFNSQIPSIQEHVITVTAMNECLKLQLCSVKEKLSSLTQQIEDLQHENTVLNDKLCQLKGRCLSFENMQDTDRCKFYTGLPVDTLNVLIEHLLEQSGHIHDTDEGSKKDEICMVLSKFRLNLLHQDMAYRQGISLSTVSRKFHYWLDVLYKTLGGLIIWPPHDIPMQLPPVFRNRFLKDVKVVLDCFEIFIERPDSLKARAQTYSNYKSHNTAKVLLGVSPSGSITHVSKTWGGRASDKRITLNSGVLDKLHPNDGLLADRGFLIRDECSSKGIKLIMPAFTKGRKQLSRKEVEVSRLYSRARIHVEKIINKCRYYRMLKGPIPISLLQRPSEPMDATLDKSVTVCCALTNMVKPVLAS